MQCVKDCGSELYKLLLAELWLKVESCELNVEMLAHADWH